MLAGIGDVASIIVIVEFIPKLCKLVDNLRKHKKTKAEIRVIYGSLLEKLKDLDDKIGEINNMNPRPKLKDDLKKIISDLGKISTLFEKRPAPSLRRKVEQLIKGPSTMQKLDEAIGLLDSHIPNIQLVIDIRAQMPKFSKSLPAIPAEIVGFSRVKMILDFLGETEVGVEVRVVAVCGEGGLGKTTLLKWTLRELQKQKNNAFCMPYVEVGMHADDDKLKDLQSSIIEQLGGSQVKLQSWGHGHTEMMQQMEKMKRTNTQVCLAIDNVWERQHLSRLLPGNLGSCLPSSSYILLTTRSKEVVDELRLLRKKETPTSTSCAQSRCKLYDYDPSMLAETDAKELFRKHACLEEGKEQPLVDKMVERCQGLPLALELWGKVFAKEEKRIRWKDIVKKVPKDVKDVLQLSYEELSPEAQKAFLDIVSFFKRWEWSIVSCIVGGDELEELESRSLLKPDYQQRYTYGDFCEELGNSIRGPSPIKRVKIHDLIFEMGNDVAKSQGNRLTKREWIQEHAHNSQELHKIEGIWPRLTLWKEEAVGGDVLGKMQSLRILRTKIVLLDQCPPLATSLQCLDLDCNRGAWEMPIGKYTNMSLLSLRDLDWDFNRAQFPDGLRQLYLHGCHGLVELPSNSFRELGMLEVLHLHDCRLLERLPTTMGTLQELRELVVVQAPHFQELTPSVLTDLTKMRLLCLRGCLCLTNLPDVEWNLSKLTTLRLQRCKRLTATCVPISALTSLETLSLEQMHHLEISPSDLAELHVLKELSYAGCKNMSSLPETLGNLTLLERLDLRGCQSLTCLPETLGKLTLLERLDLTGCQSLTCLPGSALGKLVQLKELTLAGCSSLARLPVEVGELKQLRVLSLNGCNNMMEDVQLQILGGLESLQRLSLRDCHSLVTLPDCAVQSKMLEHLDLSEWRELVRLPGSITDASSLRWLDLGGCVKLSELPEDMGNLNELRSLDLRDCVELQKLPESIGGIAGLHVTISGCRGLVDLPQAVSGKLKSLEEVRGCSSLTQLPPQLWAEASFASLCSSSNIDHVLELLASEYGLTGLRKDVMTPSTLNSIREQAVPQLEKLTLAWKHTGDEAMEEEWLGMLRKATSLRDLDISLDLGETGGNLLYKTVKAMLPILSLKSSHLRISGGRCELPIEVWTLPSLCHLSLKGTIIFNLPQMLPAGLRSISLELQEMSDLQVLPPQIKHLSNLWKLEIRSCAALVSLSPEIGLLKNLKYLVIQWCASLQELPLELCNLISLSALDLEGCASLQELPLELCNLRSLSTLNLKGCTSLTHLPKSLCRLPQLEELNLEECWGLSMEEQNLDIMAPWIPITKTQFK